MNEWKFNVRPPEPAADAERDSAAALVTAEMIRRRNRTCPVIILDDILSELDLVRMNFVINNIDNSQVFITCCDKNTILRLKQGKTFHIVDGKIIN